jgi:glyceraldehyde 3-phosphate dehydrogenase
VPRRWRGTQWVTRSPATRGDGLLPPREILAGRSRTLRAPRPARPAAGANNRRFFVGGNWKANGSLKQVETLVQALNNGTVSSTSEVVVAPPSLYLQSVKSHLRKDFGVAAQVRAGAGSRARRAVARVIWRRRGRHVSSRSRGPHACSPAACARRLPLPSPAAQDAFASSGAHTGETPAVMLKDLGLKYTIVGHSERRQKWETDEIVANKAKAAIEQGITVIACLGETLAEREAGKAFEVVTTQLAVRGPRRRAEEAQRRSSWRSPVVTTPSPHPP